MRRAQQRQGSPSLSDVRLYCARSSIVAKNAIDLVEKPPFGGVLPKYPLAAARTRLLRPQGRRLYLPGLILLH
jgi:hypothetical protein